MSLETINFDFLKLRSDQNLLDLGCGEGRHAITACLRENLVSVGVDLNLKDLNTAKERFAPFADNGNTTLIIAAANGQTLPFAGNTFDRVICSEVLEHIENYEQVISEILRVTKPGGLLAVSVPRFGPEWVCWKLSSGYHQAKGGHIRIFNANKLKTVIEETGFIHFKKHWAHALHVPYWWLKCLFWKSDNEMENGNRGESEDEGENKKKDENEKDVWIVKIYHKFLVWDLMKKPWITRTLERLLNPLMGKSVVMYFVKVIT